MIILHKSMANPTLNLVVSQVDLDHCNRALAIEWSKGMVDRSATQIRAMVASRHPMRISTVNSRLSEADAMKTITSTEGKEEITTPMATEEREEMTMAALSEDKADTVMILADRMKDLITADTEKNLLMADSLKTYLTTDDQIMSRLTEEGVMTRLPMAGTITQLPTEDTTMLPLMVAMMTHLLLHAMTTLTLTAEETMNTIVTDQTIITADRKVSLDAMMVNQIRIMVDPLLEDRKSPTDVTIDAKRRNAMPILDMAVKTWDIDLAV